MKIDPIGKTLFSRIIEDIFPIADSALRVGSDFVRSPETDEVVINGVTKTFKMEKTFKVENPTTPTIPAKDLSRFRVAEAQDTVRAEPVVTNSNSSSTFKIEAERPSNDPIILELADLIKEKSRKGLASLAERITGIKIYDIGNTELNNEYATAIGQLIELKHLIPDDVKHFVVGHGLGKAESGSWSFVGKNIKVFDYINSHIPKGEKTLVLACQEGKPMNFNFSSGSTSNHGEIYHPLVIVESGKNQISSTLNF